VAAQADTFVSGFQEVSTKPQRSVAEEGIIG